MNLLVFDRNGAYWSARGDDLIRQKISYHRSSHFVDGRNHIDKHGSSVNEVLVHTDLLDVNGVQFMVEVRRLLPQTAIVALAREDLLPERQIELHNSFGLQGYILSRTKSAKFCKKLIQFATEAKRQLGAS